MPQLVPAAVTLPPVVSGRGHGQAKPISLQSDVYVQRIQVKVKLVSFCRSTGIMRGVAWRMLAHSGLCGELSFGPYETLGARGCAMVHVQAGSLLSVLSAR